jgi:transketolase
MMSSIDKLTVTNIRMLSVDQIDAASSGHPGLPLGAAPAAYTLWAKCMRHNPRNPSFFNRDRFVLSAGHGSALLYSLLHVFQYGLSKEDLMRFRQLKSFTPGHPEYGHTVGVETSTGPLGQGAANAVGMAIAEKMLAARFNKDGFNIVDHHTYALLGDGCMMEGIESEAASLAGTLGLNKLIFLYDKNNITIEGATDGAFLEDVGKRHEAQGFNVLTVEDGEDGDAIENAISLAKKSKSKPSLIIINTQIGFGSPLAGKAEAHGAPLKKEDLTATKKYFKHKLAPFETAPEVRQYCKEIAEGLSKCEDDWKKLLKNYKKEYPALADGLNTYIQNKPPETQLLSKLYDFTKPDSTRNASGIVLNKLAALMPNLIGGAADLAPSTKTEIKGGGFISSSDMTGRNIHFGVREHAMAAISNGIYLHGGFSVFCSTFFAFSDYMKNAIRLSALMGVPVIYIFTHDSIGVGEDGPTHQPIEQLSALRSIPNLNVFRPCDGKETAAAWISAITQKQPTVLVLSRQTLDIQKGDGNRALNGGYTLIEAKKEIPDMLLIASGSEVGLAVAAQAVLLQKHGIDARVISMPSVEVFERQSARYKETVMPSAVRARVAIEAGSTMPWYKYTGLDGAVIGIDGFGMSGPSDRLFEIYGFSVENAVNVALKTFKKLSKPL